MSLFNVFLSTASQRFQYTCSIIGPNTPIIASSHSPSNNKNEIHIQRMPRSVTSGMKDFLSFYKRQEMTMMTTLALNVERRKSLPLLLEKLLDEIVEKLLPDGSRIFQAFVSCLVIEVGNENRILKGLLSASTSEKNLKIVYALVKCKEEILIPSFLRGRKGNDRNMNNDESVAKMISSCLMRIALTEHDNNQNLARLTTALAMNMMPTNIDEDEKNIHGNSSSSPAIITELVGFPIQHSKVLPQGVFLLPIQNDYHNNLAVQKLRTLLQQTRRSNGCGFSLLLVRKFDFINFGSGGGGESSSDSSSSDSENSSSSSSDEDDEIQVPTSISDIVQIYRQEINLSDSTAQNYYYESKIDWLHQLVSFCRSTVVAEQKKNNRKVVILCQQKLPEGARCINEGIVEDLDDNLVLLDGVEKETFDLIEQMSRGRKFPVKVPFRAELNDLPTRNCLLQVDSFNEVRFSESHQENANLFEIKISSSLTNLMKGSIICGPSLSIVRDVKKTVLNLVKCMRLSHSSLKRESIWTQMLNFSREMRRKSDELKLNNSSSSLEAAILECISSAAFQTVFGVLLSSSSTKNTKMRSETQLKVLRFPECLKDLVFDFEKGEWKGIFANDEEETANEAVEFDWILEHIMIASVDFLVLMLKSEVYC